MLPRFYCADLAMASTHLPDAVAQHIRVRRLRVGDALELFDGSGHVCQGRVAALERRQITLHLEPPHAAPATGDFQITLGQALLSAEKMDWVVQKATELGATSVQPVLTERAWKLDGERLDKRLAHWRAVAIAACEQCGRNHLPLLQPPVALADLTEPGYYLTLAHAPRLRELPAVTRATLLVGPEGGWSGAEEHHLQHAGWQPLSLGPRVLRTETAALAALAAVQALWGNG